MLKRLPINGTVECKICKVSIYRSHRCATQHENGDLGKIKVCVSLRKVGHPTLRKLSTARKGL